MLSARLVRFHAHLDVGVDHPFDGDEDFHSGQARQCGVGTQWENKDTRAPARPPGSLHGRKLSTRPSHVNEAAAPVVFQVEI